MLSEITPPLNLDKVAKKYGVSRKHLDYILAIAKKSVEPVSKKISVIESNRTQHYTVTRKGIGPLQTSHGILWQFVFEINDAWIKYNAILAGDINFETLQPRIPHRSSITIRTDSGCETGQIFDDLTCDCRKQLHLAMQMIAKQKRGVIVNIPHQDGRGMGLPFKLATLFLQNQLDLDTVESAKMLAPRSAIDVRTYSGVVGVLKFLGIQPNTKLNLATNNPRKESVFMDNGYKLVSTPVIAIPNKYNKRHLEAKDKFLGHRIFPRKK